MAPFTVCPKFPLTHGECVRCRSRHSVFGWVEGRSFSSSVCSNGGPPSRWVSAPFFTSLGVFPLGCPATAWPFLDGDQLSSERPGFKGFIGPLVVGVWFRAPARRPGPGVQRVEVAPLPKGTPLEGAFGACTPAGVGRACRSHHSDTSRSR